MVKTLSKPSEVLVQNQNRRHVVTVTYDFAEFLELTDPTFPIRFTLKIKPMTDITKSITYYRYVLRMYGIDFNNNLIVFETASPIFFAETEQDIIEWKMGWIEIINKLEARPGKYLLR